LFSCVILYSLDLRNVLDVAQKTKKNMSDKEEKDEKEKVLAAAEGSCLKIQKSPIVTLYVDGGFTTSGTPRAGASVIFSVEDDHNDVNQWICVPLPCSSLTYEKLSSSSSPSSSLSFSSLSSSTLSSSSVSSLSSSFSSSSSSSSSSVPVPTLSWKTTFPTLSWKTTFPLPYDSLRAELYAALCGIYLIQTTDGMYSPYTKYRIKQDCIAAIMLLRWAHRTKMAPSLMYQQRKNDMTANNTLPILLPWNTELTMEDIGKYQDVLDEWWFWTRDFPRIELCWIPAHTDNVNKFELKAAKGLNYDPTTKEMDFKGNKKADLWAKSACNVKALEHSQITGCFSKFPLYNLE
jgi:hypothetical protein